jgi:hypothetical protein
VNIKSLNDASLVEQTHLLVKEERRLGVEVIRHLREISVRRLYLERGYPSLFEMCVTEFKYSAAAAQRRIEAMRLIQDLPEVERKIETGELSLSAAAQVQSFLRREEKPYSQEEKRELIQQIEGKSTRDVERELAKRNPELAPPEKTRWIREDRIELRLSLDAATYENLEKLKHLLSHKKPNMSFERLIGELTDIALEKLDPERREKRIQARRERQVRTQIPTGAQALEPSSFPAPEMKPRLTARAIPSTTRRAVFLRDGGRCTHRDPKTGRQCESRHLPQVDHIHPKSLGGTHDSENLRILCAAHNQHRTRETWPEERGRRSTASGDGSERAAEPA